jgi:hypothetical protein
VVAIWDYYVIDRNKEEFLMGWQKALQSFEMCIDFPGDQYLKYAISVRFGLRAKVFTWSSPIWKATQA